MIRTSDREMENELFDGNAWLGSFVQGAGGFSEPAVPYGGSARPRNAVVEETFELASRVMDYCELFVKVNPVFADQILRSGTSVGSHVREAQGAQSLKAFINKMKVAHQELEETDYRLDLCHIKSHYPHDTGLVALTKGLFPLFSSILSTSKQRLRESKVKRPKP